MKKAKSSFLFQIGITLILGAIIGGGVFYLFINHLSQKTETKTTNIQNQTNNTTSTSQIRFTANENTEWKTFNGKYYPFSFSYPSTLPLVVFINDTKDTVAISFGNIPPQQNILLNLEFLDQHDPKYLKKPKIEYVKDWYKFFSGLKGVAKVEAFTNTSGLKGYKAYYINYANSTPNVDVFFEVPNSPHLMIHMANGILTLLFLTACLTVLSGFLLLPNRKNNFIPEFYFFW